MVSGRDRRRRRTSRRIRRSIALFWIAFVLTFFSLFAPIHELGHGIAAFLSGSRFVLYYKVTYVEDPNFFIIIFGYIFDLLFWSSIVYFSKKKRPFIYGIVVATVVQGMISKDLSDALGMGYDLITLVFLWWVLCTIILYQIYKKHGNILKT